jgi:DNA-binding NtrC family response regulator
MRELVVGRALELRDAEVEHLRDTAGAIFCEEDVGRLEIAVDDAARVRMGNAARDLDHDRGRVGDRQRASLDLLREVSALEQLHHDEGRTVRLAGVERAHHVAAAQELHRANFSCEPRAKGDLVNRILSQRLERDARAGAQVERLVENGHSPLGEGPHDAVVTDRVVPHPRQAYRPWPRTAIVGYDSTGVTDDDASTSTRAVSRPDSPDGAVLVILAGAARGRSFPLPCAIGQRMRIGTAEDNDVVLEDDTVSRRHLEIVRTANGLQLRDLGSTNGTRVGGVRIQEAFLSPGALLDIGEVPVSIGVALDAVAVPASENDRFGLAVGRSRVMRRLFGVLERVAKTNANVMLTGETGTGKDVLARSIHLESGRMGGFEVLDCGAIVPSLVESELFGHERGAFTGAVASRAGAFERAEGGTLFLDELGELPLDLQPKLLRVLEAREFRRVGGQRTMTADVRIVAATCRDLRAEVAAGRFREDLYYRLAVVSLHVPPLRDRREDIPVLAEHIVEDKTKVPDGIMAKLVDHDWPGNVRELRNVLDRLTVMSSAPGELQLFDSPRSERIERTERAEDPKQAEPVAPPEPYDPSHSYRETRARFEAGFEASYVKWLLARNGGNLSAAAREARMDRNHLSDLARRHGLRIKP